MKPVVVLMCLVAMLILIGCTELQDPMEPQKPDGSGRRQPASPFYDATRPEPPGDLPAWEDRPAEEREAWRERHR